MLGTMAAELASVCMFAANMMGKHCRPLLYIYCVCVCVCVCCEKERGLRTVSVHCPLSEDYMFAYYFNQVVTVSFPLILCNNLY